MFTVQNRDKNFTQTKNNMLYYLKIYCNGSIRNRKGKRGIIFRLVGTVVQWRALVDVIMNVEVMYNARFINANSCVYTSFSGKTLFI
jgi:hypothetical protein